jgi:hypothetical protein
MKSKQILFFAALGCMTAPVAAQEINARICQDGTFVINSTAPVSATGTISYRWLENGVPITGATVTSHTIQAGHAAGDFSYVRQAKSTTCTDWQSSNVFTVRIFENETDDGVCFNGALWAKRNVDSVGKFAASPDSMGKLYQFNSKIAYPDNNPDVTGAWHPDNNVCPTGWFIPSHDAIVNLRNHANIIFHTKYATSEQIGTYFSPLNASDGRQIFLPSRLPDASWHWSTEELSETQAASLKLWNNSVIHQSTPRDVHYPVRCVQE